jgi:hypothetical protein
MLVVIPPYTPGPEIDGACAGPGGNAARLR